MKMFQKIQELIDDKDALVFVLMDEVSAVIPERFVSLEYMYSQYSNTLLYFILAYVKFTSIPLS